MADKIYNKLIRDTILDKIIANGEQAKFHIASLDEYISKLHEKVLEEAQEIIESPGDIDELCDMLEVIYAIAEAYTISKDELEAKRVQKVATRGAFTKKIILEKVITKN